MHDQDVVREFLSESREGLSRMELEVLELEKRPKDAALLGSVFRTIHTIKGTCGFLGFSLLEKIAHQAESILSQLRDGNRELTPPLTSLMLETVDAIGKILTAIENTGQEGEDSFTRLKACLRNAAPALSETEAAAAEKPMEQTAKAPPHADANIRVGVGLLDKLMDLVGELVLTRNQIIQFNAGREDSALNATSQRLNLITSELQEGVMKTRMQPIGTVWNKVPRLVRDMALALGKQIRLEMDGAGTELDRTIIEAIKDPLVHLVRNACDHGIETPECRVRCGKAPQGKLTLRAWHEGGQVNIEIADDGAGVNVEKLKQKAIAGGYLREDAAQKLSDREALNLIFHAGLSTATAVTNISGRGVGMDVVKSNIEKIGGVVELAGRACEGLTVRLKIPLTLAIIPGLVITSGDQRSSPRAGSGATLGERFVIPQVSLLELIRLEEQGGRSQIERIHGTPFYRRRGSLLPIVYLNHLLDLKCESESAVLNIVVLQAEDKQFGLVVDGINDTQEIVVKPLSRQLKGLSVYAGATIMGDGRVALILDVPGIGQRSGVLGESREQTRAVAERRMETGAERQRLLLFRAGSFQRLAVPLSLVSRLEEIPRSSIERAGGHEVVQYRDRILPLIPLHAVLEPGEIADTPTDPAQVIVFNDGDRSLGVVVDRILDIAEETITVRQRAARAGLLGSGVVGKQVADFLDLHYVIRGAAGDWLRAAAQPARHRRVLLADASLFSRGLIRGGLDMAGYVALEAASAEEALRGLERESVDIVVAALDLPPNGCEGLVEAMRKRPEWERIPVLALAESAEQIAAGNAISAKVQECLVKFDREAMLESLARLAAALGDSAVGKELQPA
jgi:two-component system chemotaxis sensor kinase CheA